jgi:hypothetical protein
VKHVSPRDRDGLRHGIPLVSLDGRLAPPSLADNPSPWTRRRFLGFAVLAATAGVAGCGPDVKTAALREKAKQLGASLDCSDISDLQPAEARTRDDNQYRQHSYKDDQFCLGCLNFVPATVETACGTCKTVRGPINPAGWCTQWTKARS